MNETNLPYKDSTELGVMFNIGNNCNITEDIIIKKLKEYDLYKYVSLIKKTTNSVFNIITNKDSYLINMKIEEALLKLKK